MDFQRSLVEERGHGRYAPRQLCIDKHGQNGNTCKEHAPDCPVMCAHRTAWHIDNANEVLHEALQICRNAAHTSSMGGLRSLQV